MSGILANIMLGNGSSGGGGGGGGGGSYSIAPTTQTEFGATPSFTFAGEVITGPAPTSYTWTIINSAGGSWSIFSGAGTSTAVAQVINVTIGLTVTAELQCAVLSGGVTYYLSAPLSYERA